jgi:hypothetical protein
MTVIDGVQLKKPVSVTAKGAKEAFGVSRYTLNQMWRNGHVRARKMGDNKQAQMLYNFKDIAEHLGFE